MSGLPADLASLVRVSAALAGRDSGALDRALADAAAAARPLEVEEALLQSYLFLGYPAALNALARWRARVGVVASGARGIGDAAAAGPESWSERGERTCRAVYGDQYEALRRNVRSIHPDLDTWMVTEGYGKVLGRPGLALERRELCVVAVLAGQVPAVERQLYAHLRGALRAGASVERVEATLRAALETAAPSVRSGALAVWGRVLSRSRGAPRPNRDAPAG